MTNSARIVIFFAEGLISLLSYQDDFTVVGEAEDAESARDRARALEPDIVLMDKARQMAGSGVPVSVKPEHLGGFTRLPATAG